MARSVYDAKSIRSSLAQLKRKSTHADSGRPHLGKTETQSFQFSVRRPQTVDGKQSLDHVKVVSELSSNSVDDDR